MALTDAKVRALKGKDAVYKISDSEGLYVLVPPVGSKLWRLAYRYLGKQKTLVLGKYPTMSLLEARRARDDAKRHLSQGTDPSNIRKAEKRERMIAAGNTFEAVAEEWFETNRGRWVDNAVCQQHSDMVNAFTEHQKKAREAIRRHFLASGDAEFKAQDSEIVAAQTALDGATAARKSSRQKLPNLLLRFSSTDRRPIKSTRL